MASKTKKGFTIIEVILFLAVSGALVAGIIATTSGTLARRRYNDSVEDIVSHLREIYADALNTELELEPYDTGLDCMAGAEAGKGRGNCVVYGTIASIDMVDDVMRIQEMKLVGPEYDPQHDYDKDKDCSYTEDNADSNAKDVLVLLCKMGVTFGYNDPDGNAHGFSEKIYRARWGAGFENVTQSFSGKISNDKSFSIIVARDPENGDLIGRVGAVGLFEYGKDTLSLDGERSKHYPFDNTNFAYQVFRGYSAFICINPGGGESVGKHRRLIKIENGVANESAVQLIDSEDPNYEGACN